MSIFIILIVVMVSQMCMYIKTPQSVYFKYVYFIALFIVNYTSKKLKIYNNF